MGTVASELKSEREKRKISLAQIAAETRISLRHLQSLEEGRFSDLPGGMYNRAFLKAYCESLNIDPQEIIDRFESELSPVLEKPLKSRAQIPQSSHSLISPVVIWGLMLLISAAGIFFSRKWITAIFSPYFSHTPASAVPYEPVPVAPPAKPAPTETAAATTAPTTVPTTGATADSAGTEPAVGPTMPSSSAESPAAAAPVQPAAETGIPSAASPATAAPAAQQALRLDINATEQCWISVDRDGSPAIRKVMAPGEVQSFSAMEKFQIVLGNAGGVHLKINGKPSKPLGKPGEVVKVLIDTKNLQDFIDQTAG